MRVESGRLVRLTTSTPFVNPFSIICGAVDGLKPHGPLWSIRGIALLYYFIYNCEVNKFCPAFLHGRVLFFCLRLVV
jgi:hypothetical protein